MHFKHLDFCTRGQKLVYIVYTLCLCSLSLEESHSWVAWFPSFNNNYYRQPERSMLQYQLAPTWIGTAFSFTLSAVSGNLLNVQCTFQSSQYNKIIRLNLAIEQFFFKEKISADKNFVQKIIMKTCNLQVSSP